MRIYENPGRGRIFGGRYDRNLYTDIMVAV